MKKGIISLLMVLVLVMSSMTVFAAGPTEVGSSDALKTALKNGGEIKLTDAITTSEGFVVDGKEVTLDLNGFAITGSEDGFAIKVINGGTLTVEDSSVEGDGVIAAAYPIRVGENRNSVKEYTGKDTVIINGGVIQGTWGVTVFGEGTLTVNDGEINGTYMAISGNGYDVNGGTTITINGGMLTGATGIYQPQNGTLVVNAGEITGTTGCGIEIRAGELDVNGGVITSEGEYSAASNGSGTTVNGAAIAVSQHTTNQEIKVTISDAELVGEYAVCETDVEDKDTDNIISVIVEDSVLDGKVASENAKEIIGIGVNFTDSAYSESAKDLLAKNVELKEDGTVVCTHPEADKYTAGAKAATCTATGNEANTYCGACDEMLEAGKVIAKLDHKYADGKCSVCGTADPDNKAPESPKTGDASTAGLYIIIAVAAAAAVGGLRMRKVAR